jgi:copper homeostasis protein
LSVTFHRAFDEAADLLAALEQVIRTGADRILTSGGAGNAEAGSPMLSELVQKAAGRVGILACGAIRKTNVRKIIQATSVHEVHASLLRRSGEEQALAQPALRPETVARFLEAARS